MELQQHIDENVPLSGGYRDFEGYKGACPDPKWPGGAKICVNFILNYEEGGEYKCVSVDGAFRCKHQSTLPGDLTASYLASSMETRTASL